MCRSCVLSARYLKRVPAQIARGANGWPALAALMAEEGDEGRLTGTCRPPPLCVPKQAEKFLLRTFWRGISLLPGPLGLEWFWLRPSVCRAGFGQNAIRSNRHAQHHHADAQHDSVL